MTVTRPIIYFISAAWVFSSLYLWTIVASPYDQINFVDLLLLGIILFALTLPIWLPNLKARWAWGLLLFLTGFLGLVAFGFHSKSLRNNLSLPIIALVVSPDDADTRLKIALLYQSWGLDEDVFSPVPIPFDIYGLRLQSDLSEAEQAAVQMWRNTKHPLRLREAGYGVLLYSETWLGNTSTAEYLTITDPTCYRPLDELQVEGERYFISEILGCNHE